MSTNLKWFLFGVVFKEIFWKFFRWVFPVKIRQQFIEIASLIANFCTIKASQGFFRVLKPNILLKNHFNNTNQDLTSIFSSRFHHQNLQKITLKTTPLKKML